MSNHLGVAGLVQVAYKNATAVAFHSVEWHKIQTFFTGWGTLAFTFMSCIRPVAQELDKIHVLVYMRASFVDLLRELVSLV